MTRRTPRCLGATLALLAAGGCAGRHHPGGEPRGRAVCVEAGATPASLIRSGDRAIDLRWCGPRPYLEKGYWLPATATIDDVLDGFPNLGYGLVLADVVSVRGEQDPGGWIHTMVQVRIVDAATVLGPGTGPYGAGAVPFRFEDGTVSIDGVLVRSPHHERAVLVPSRRYLFTYAQEYAVPNPWAGPVWAVEANGRISGAVGDVRGRRWMHALIGQDAQALVDRLERRRPVAR